MEQLALPTRNFKTEERPAADLDPAMRPTRWHDVEPNWRHVGAVAAEIVAGAERAAA